MGYHAEQFWTRGLRLVRKVEEHRTRQTLLRDIETVREAEAVFDTITYDKGDLILKRPSSLPLYFTSMCQVMLYY